MVALKRGDVCWVDFGPPRGSAPGFRRPALIIQAQKYNESRISTVVVAAITSNTRLANYGDNVFIPEGAAGLDRDSVVNVTQLFTLDRQDIETVVGSLPTWLMDQVGEGLKSVLEL